MIGLLLLLLFQRFFYLLFVAGGVGIFRIQLQRTLIGRQGGLQLAGLGESVASIVMGGTAIFSGKAFGGATVVPGAILGNPAPLFVGKGLRRLFGLLLLQQALALLVIALPQVTPGQGITILGGKHECARHQSQQPAAAKPQQCQWQYRQQ